MPIMSNNNNYFYDRLPTEFDEPYQDRSVLFFPNRLTMSLSASHISALFLIKTHFFGIFEVQMKQLASFTNE